MSIKRNTQTAPGEPVEDFIARRTAEDNSVLVTNRYFDSQDANGTIVVKIGGDGRKEMFELVNGLAKEMPAEDLMQKIASRLER